MSGTFGHEWRCRRGPPVCAGSGGESGGGGGGYGGIGEEAASGLPGSGQVGSRTGDPGDPAAGRERGANIGRGVGRAAGGLAGGAFGGAVGGPIGAVGGGLVGRGVGGRAGAAIGGEWGAAAARGRGANAANAGYGGGQGSEYGGFGREGDTSDAEGGWYYDENGQVIETPPQQPSGGGGEEGGGGEGGGGGDAFASFLLDWLQARRSYVEPFERELYGQGLEALTTGGVGARLPMIQQAVEASKQATSRALGETTESLAQAGLHTTQFGQRTLSGLRLAGAQNAARIPTDFAREAIALVAGQLPQTGASITSGAAEGYRGEVAQAIAELNAASAEKISMERNLTELDIARMRGEDVRYASDRQRDSDMAKYLLAAGGAVGQVLAGYGGSGTSAGSSGGGKTL